MYFTWIVVLTVLLYSKVHAQVSDALLDDLVDIPWGSPPCIDMQMCSGPPYHPTCGAPLPICSVPAAPIIEVPSSEGTQSPVVPTEGPPSVTGAGQTGTDTGTNTSPNTNTLQPSTKPPTDTNNNVGNTATGNTPSDNTNTPPNTNQPPGTNTLPGPTNSPTNTNNVLPGSTPSPTTNQSPPNTNQQPPSTNTPTNTNSNTSPTNTNQPSPNSNQQPPNTNGPTSTPPGSTAPNVNQPSPNTNQQSPNTNTPTANANQPSPNTNSQPPNTNKPTDTNSNTSPTNTNQPPPNTNQQPPNTNTPTDTNSNTSPSNTNQPSSNNNNNNKQPSDTNTPTNTNSNTSPSNTNNPPPNNNQPSTNTNPPSDNTNPPNNKNSNTSPTDNTATSTNPTQSANTASPSGGNLPPGKPGVSVNCGDMVKSCNDGKHVTVTVSVPVNGENKPAVRSSELQRDSSSIFGFCPVTFKRKGCYKDKHDGIHPLPELLFTDRDSSSKMFSGTVISSKDWKNYVLKLICRCAESANQKRFTFFGIQRYGDCWSGMQSSINSYAIQGTSKACIGRDQTPCEADSEACVGENGANFVYELTGGPGPEKKDRIYRQKLRRKLAKSKRKRNNHI